MTDRKGGPISGHPDAAKEDNKEWVDGTKLLKEASAEMNLGEMILDKDFTLFDAMSALELMDPKMDSGMRREDLSEFTTVDELISAGKLPTRLTFQEATGVIDKLQVFVEAFHMGEYLPLTIFKCLYCHRGGMKALEVVAKETASATPETDRDGYQNRCAALAIRAIVASVLKTSRIVRQVVHHADIYEEEDFYPDKKTPLDMEEEMDDEKFIFNLLKSAEAACLRTTKSTQSTVLETTTTTSAECTQLSTTAKTRSRRRRKKRGKKKKKNKAIAEESPGNEGEEEAKEGKIVEKRDTEPKPTNSSVDDSQKGNEEGVWARRLACRLRMWQYMLEIHIQLIRPNFDGISKARETLNALLSWMARSGLASLDREFCCHASQSPKLAFDDDDASLVKSMFRQAAPRAPKIPSFEEARRSLTARLIHLKRVCALSACGTIRRESPYWLRRFLEWSPKEGEPLILSRSLMLMMIANKECKLLDHVEPSSYASDAIFQFGVPWASFLSARPSSDVAFDANPPAGMISLDRSTARASDLPSPDELFCEIRSYIVYASRSLSDFLKLMCLNRCRQRTRLHIVLHDWANLQNHADYVDAVLGKFGRGRPKLLGSVNVPARGFGVWHLQHVLELMLHHLLIGFELELYAPWEVDSVYWYADFVLGSMIQ
eukprot:g5026.t1